MLTPWLLCIKTILFISIVESVNSWNPPCNPCRCSIPNPEKPQKVSDCSSAITSVQLRKIPQLKDETEVVFLVGQDIEVIPQDAFFDGRQNQLKFVDLKNCKVRSIHVNAFRNLENLSGLDLSDNKLSQIEDKTFRSNSKIKILVLRHSDLKVLPEEIFYNLPILEYLDLSENKLQHIYPNQFKNNINLERLILQSNYLTRFEQSFIKNLPKLNVLYLDNNPWKCDCKTKDLQRFIIDRNIDFVYNNEYPSCSLPKQYKGKKWLEVKPKDLCSVPETSSKTVAEGDAFDVHCNIDTINQLPIEWLFNGQPLDVSNTKKYQTTSLKNTANSFLYKLKINDIKLKDIGVYKCWTNTLKDSDIQFEETILNVEKATPPTITGPKNEKKLVKTGTTNYKISCGASGKPKPQVQWLFNGAVLNLPTFGCKRRIDTDNDLLFERFDSACFGNYVCHATSSGGSADKNFEFQPLPETPEIIPDPSIDDHNAYEGFSVSLDCIVSEAVKIDVIWLRNGQPITPNQFYSIDIVQIDTNKYNYILSIKGISYNQAGNYKCSANGVESPEYNINVVKPKPPTIPGAKEETKLVKTGTSNYKISCDASGTPKPEVQWLFNGAVLNLPTYGCKRRIDTNNNDLLFEIFDSSCFGNYVCKATSSGGVAEKNFELEPLPSTPEIIPDPSIDDHNAYEGSSVSLDCIVSEAVKIDVKWLRNGQPITPNQFYSIDIVQIDTNKYNYILSIKGISYNQAGNYKCSANGVESPEYNINVVKPKPPTIPGAKEETKLVKTGTSNYKISCDASGTPKPEVQWLFNGAVLNLPTYGCKRRIDTNNNDLLFEIFDSSCFGNYVCKATSYGGVAEKNFELEPLPSTPEIIPDPSIDDHNAYEGSSVSLDCIVSEAVKIDVKWLRNGQPITPNQFYSIDIVQIDTNKYNYILSIKGISYNQAGNYKCSANGVESPEYNINVVKPKPPTIPGAKEETKLVKTGTSNYRISCDASGTPKPEVQWLFNGAVLNLPTYGCKRRIDTNNNDLLFEIFDSSCFGKYVCKATSSGGVAEKNFELEPLPSTPEIIPDPSIDDHNAYEGSSVSLDCIVSEAVKIDVKWLRNGQPITPNQFYSIDIVQIDTNKYNYILSIKGISYNQAGNYKCSANGVESPEYNINVVKPKSPTIPGAKEETKLVKTGTSNYRISCDASGTPKPEVQWLFNGAVLNLPTYGCKSRIDTNNNDLLFEIFDSSCFGNYVCKATSSGGVAEKNFEIQPVPDIPEIIPDPSIDDHNAYDGSSITLDCIVSEAVKIKVKWLRNGQTITPNHIYSINIVQIDASKYNYILKIKGISFNQAGNYKCNANGVESPEYTVNVVKPKPPTIPGAKEETKLVKTGTSNYKISCDASGTPKPEVQWLFNGAVLNLPTNGCKRRIGTNNNDLLFEIFDSSCFGNYVCRATSSGGVAEKNFEIQPVPGIPEIIPGSSIDDHNAYEGSSITLDCIVSEAVKVNVKWLRNGQSITPNHIYSINIVQIDASKYNYILKIKGISFNQAGNYKCNANGVESPEYTVNVVKPKPPTIPGAKEETKLVQTGTSNYKISCDASGTPKPEVQWLFNGAVLNLPTNGCKRRIGTNNNDLLFEIFDSSCFGNYVCRATSSGGVAEKNFEIQPVPGIPEIIPGSSIDDHNAYEGSSVTLDCIVSEAVKVNVKWLRNGQSITPNHIYSINIVQIDARKYNYILRIKGISFTEAGNYKCSANGVESPEYTVNVIEPSIEDFDGGNDLNLEIGDSKDVKCKVKGVPKSAIHWEIPTCSKDSFANGETLHLLNVNCAGRYKCVIQTSRGRIEKEFNLSLKIPTIVEVKLITRFTDNKVFENEDITLSCLVDGAVKSKPHWYFKNSNTSIQNNQLYDIKTIPIDQNRFYYNLRIKNTKLSDASEYKCAIGSQVSKNIVLNVKPAEPPSIDYIPDTVTYAEDGQKDIKLECKIAGSHVNAGWQSNNKLCNYKQAIEDRGDYKVAVLIIKEVTPACKGQFKCSANNKVNSVEKVVNLDVIKLQPPETEIDTNNINNEVVENDDVILKCLVRGAAQSKPQWLFNDNYGPNKYHIVQEMITDTSYWYNLVIKNIKSVDAMNYRCVIGNFEQSIPVNVKPSVQPNIVSISESNSFVVGMKNARISCRVTGFPKPRTNWLKKGSFGDCRHTITTEQDGNSDIVHLTFLEVTLSCAGQYYCHTDNSKGRSMKDVDILVISEEEPPTIQNLPSVSQVVEEDDVTLKCVVKSRLYEPEWLHQGHVIQNNDKYRIEKVPITKTSYFFNLIISKVSEQDKGSYKCRVNNLETEATIDVQKGKIPIIDEIPNPGPIEEGKKDLTFSCRVNGIPKPKVSWYYEGHEITPQLPSNQFGCKYILSSEMSNPGYAYRTELLYLTVQEILPSCAGKYKCVAENSKGGEEREINLSVTKVEPPVISQPPTEVYENSNVTLQCLIKGSVDSKPSWLHNNRKIELNDKYKVVMIPIDQSSYWYNLEITDISQFDRGNYKCKINNQETEINLTPLPSSRPIIFKFPSNELEYTEGGKNLTIPCQATGNPLPKITWLFNNIPVDQNPNKNCPYRIVTEPGNKVSLVIQNVIPSCSGKYKCVTENIKGTNEKETNIKINPTPGPKIELEFPGSHIVLEDDIKLKCLVPNRRYRAKWYKEDNEVVPNGRYSIDYEPINITAYWHNLVITNIKQEDKANYKCKIHNAESVIPIIDVVSPVKLTIEYIPNRETGVLEGMENFKLACKVSGIPKPEITWYVPNKNCKHNIKSEVKDTSEWSILTIEKVTSICKGIYKCVTSNSAGSDEKEINLSIVSTMIKPEVTLETKSPDGVIRQNDDVTIKCLTTGSDNSKIDWYLNNRPIDTNNKSKYELGQEEVNHLTTRHYLTIKNITISDRGNYICKTNNIHQSINVNIKLPLLPTVEYYNPPKLTIDEGTAEVTLPCKVTDAGDYDADWTLNGRNLEDSSCTSGSTVTHEKTRHFEWYNLTINNISPTCSGKFKCVIRNLGDEDNIAIDVTVLRTKALVIDMSTSSFDKTIREKDTVTLKCLITSSKLNAAKWTYKGREITSNAGHKITTLRVDDTSYWYNLEIQSISKQQSGDYKCSTHKSEISRVVTVNPGLKPTIEHISNSEMFVEEGTKEITLFCQAKGSPVPNISWDLRRKPQNCDIQTTNEGNLNTQWAYLKIRNVNPSCTARFVCIASNSEGSQSKNVDLTVIPQTKPPEISINTTSADKIIREGDDVVLSCFVTGKTKKYSPWLFKPKYGDNYKEDFKFYTHEINPLTYRYDLIIKKITLEKAGRYKCTTDKNMTESHIDIEVHSGLVPEIEKFPDSGNVVIYNGATRTLFCKASGSPKPEVTWLYNGQPLDKLNQIRCRHQIESNKNWYNLTINSATTSCNGYYKCVAKGSKGTTEKQITVKIVPRQRPETKLLNSDGSNVVKVNDKITLTCLVKGDINTPVVWLYNNNEIGIDNVQQKIIKQKHDDESFWYNLKIEQVSLGHTGKYSCKTTVDQSDSYLDVQTLTKATASISGQSKIYLPDGKEQHTIKCTLTGIPTPSGSWEHNNNLISGCTDGCQYDINNSTEGTYLILKNINEACSGRYKCIAENSVGKENNKFVDVIVIPKEQPEVMIQEPVHAVLNKDVTITCEVKSVDEPTITWKNHDKIVNPVGNKYVIQKAKAANNLYYSTLTIVNFQSPDTSDYTCEGSLDKNQNYKTISLKPKNKIKPEFVGPDNILDNFKLINGDLVFITKVKGYPPPTLEWNIVDPTDTEYNIIQISPDKLLKENTKYLTETSYIKDDLYWFNQTIKHFDATDSEFNKFIAKNELGIAELVYNVIYKESLKPSGRVEVDVNYGQRLPGSN